MKSYEFIVNKKTNSRSCYYLLTWLAWQQSKSHGACYQTLSYSFICYWTLIYNNASNLIYIYEYSYNTTKSQVICCRTYIIYVNLELIYYDKSCIKLLVYNSNISFCAAFSDLWSYEIKRGKDNMASAYQSKN